MDIKSYREYRKKLLREYQLEQSLKLHSLGFLTGAAVALEEDKSFGTALRYGVAGAIATLFFEVACPKVTNFLKHLL